MNHAINTAPPKIKVIYIVTNQDVGGAQKYVADLADNLKQEFNIKILYGGQDIQWLSNKVYPWLFFLNDWLAIWELVKIYKREQPQIIHLNSSKTGVLGAIAARLYKVVSRRPLVVNPKVIFTAHGWVFNPTNALSLTQRWSYILLHKIAGYFQDQIICVSKYDYQLAKYHRIATPNKLTVIHNGINPDIKFLNQKTAREILLQKLRPLPHALNPKLPWIGSIGRLTKEKNYETLVETSILVPNAYFFIIGAGDEEAALKTKGLKLKAENLFFIKPDNNDAQYLKAFDIFVMCSIKEGLPYILLEAKAA